VITVKIHFCGPVLAKNQFSNKLALGRQFIRTVTYLHVMVFWVMTLHSDIVRFDFGEPWCLHIQDKMEAARSSKTMVYFHIITWCYNPQDNLNLHCGEKIKFWKPWFHWLTYLKILGIILQISSFKWLWILLKTLKIFWSFIKDCKRKLKWRSTTQLGMFECHKKVCSISYLKFENKCKQKCKENLQSL
jgi:hypothetical protein